jgi:hypothetical protein
MRHCINTHITSPIHVTCATAHERSCSCVGEAADGLEEPAYVSIRQHTPAYVSIRSCSCVGEAADGLELFEHLISVDGVENFRAVLQMRDGRYTLMLRLNINHE